MRENQPPLDRSAWRSHPGMHGPAGMLLSAIDNVRSSFSEEPERSRDAINKFASILRAHLEAEENAAVPYLLEHPWF